MPFFFLRPMVFPGIPKADPLFLFCFDRFFFWSAKQALAHVYTRVGARAPAVYTPLVYLVVYLRNGNKQVKRVKSITK